MRLVKISDDMTIDVEKIEALKDERYNGRCYTHIYLQGDREFLVEGHTSEIQRIINDGNK